MTFNQFKTHPTYRSDWARELRENTILKIVLAVMMENNPARTPVRGDINDDVSETNAAIQLGETRGYFKYDSTLHWLSQPTVTRADIGQTSYENPPVEAH